MASSNTYGKEWGPKNRMLWMDAVPGASTDGTYEVGDVIILNTPVASNPYIYVCTVRGAPGTWKSKSLSA